MTVRLYDTQVQALRDFAPQDPTHVSMYVCGPTVQSGPGIRAAWMLGNRAGLVELL